MNDTTSDFVPASTSPRIAASSSLPPPRVAASPLFWLNLLIAVGLLALLLTSPFVLNASSPRIIRLFGGDATVRKTALAGTIGLAVTAFVFFRSRVADPPSPSHRTPPSNVVGA